jgi:hypothetical protein
MKTILLLIAVLFSTNSFAETVYVKYRGSVDLGSFSCSWTQDSLVNRLCYDQNEEYVLVQLKNTYYHYCEVPRSTVSNWLTSGSKRSYYYSNIKSRHDCRVYRMPSYSS